jgi:hypothetical protein
MRGGATLQWERAHFGRRYALVEATDSALHDELSAHAHLTVFDRPVIALAVSPTVPEALPRLFDALGGPGRPSGVMGCERVDDTLIVEWDLERTPWDTIEALIDVELHVLRSGRVNMLLTPLPLEWVARLAAHALQAPEITEDRILEEQLKRHGLHV